MDDNKKGISPLIATVLLVGLVVTIAMVVFFWYGNYLEEFLNKQGVELEASCTQDVQIYLSELSCDTYTGETFLNFKIENQGSATLRGLNVAYILDSSSGAVVESSVLPTGVSTYIQVGLEENFSGVSISLEVTPIIGLGDSSKYCDSQIQYASISC